MGSPHCGGNDSARAPHSCEPVLSLKMIPGVLGLWDPESVVCRRRQGSGEAMAERADGKCTVAWRRGYRADASSEPERRRIACGQSMKGIILSELFAAHAETLDRAVEAIDARTYWSAYPEHPEGLWRGAPAGARRASTHSSAALRNRSGTRRLPRGRRVLAVRHRSRNQLSGNHRRRDGERRRFGACGTGGRHRRRIGRGLPRDPPAAAPMTPSRWRMR